MEQAEGYRLSHGDAVAKGMYWITRISAEQGWCSRETLAALEQLLWKYDFNLTLPENREEIYRILCSDKKRQGDTIRMVIPEEVGRCVIREFHIREVKDLL